jgi:type III restriction enzyme, res subunit
VVTEFWEIYGGNTYEGLNPKLAIFASTIEEAQEEVRPIVERVIADLGLPTSKVLVNVGDTKITKDEDIRLFNELDIPGSAGNERQFLILVGKGREGWNCRSLFGVAMFRSPSSKVFVLQATMRCLRQIGDQQQTASVFLSKANFDILDAELEKNFNMDLDGLTKGTTSDTVAYQVRMLPPERTITLKQIWYEYTLENKEVEEPLNFRLEPVGHEMYDKYKAIRYEKASLTTNTTVKEVEVTASLNRDSYSLLVLVGELARFLNMSPLKIEALLRESTDGVERILEVVNAYNQVVDDVLVPTIFHAFHVVTQTVRSEDRELALLRAPKGKGYWEFRAKPELVVRQDTDRLDESQRNKSFHADTYCFDSRPELECFWQYVESEKVQEVYFTGMFTSNQGDLSIQYYDPDSQRIRSYYPDFVAKMADGSLQLIEVKGDNMIDDEVVQAKAEAAQILAAESSVAYKMYAGSLIMKTRPLADETQPELLA